MNQDRRGQTSRPSASAIGSWVPTADVQDAADSLNRSLEQLGARPRVCVVTKHPNHPTIWMYSAERSCRLRQTSDTFHGTLYWKRVELAQFAQPDPWSIARALALWAEPSLRLDDLEPFVGPLDRAAGWEAFEDGDHGGWFWERMLTRARAARSDSPLRRFVPLLEVIRTNDVVSRFFAFPQRDVATDDLRLQFSYCSHRPYDTSGLPALSYRDDSDAPYGLLSPSGIRRWFDAEAAVVALEARLDDAEQPCVGTSTDRGAKLLNARLERCGSPLRATLQRDRWAISLDDGRTIDIASIHDQAVCAGFRDSSRQEVFAYDSIEDFADWMIERN